MEARYSLARVCQPLDGGQSQTHIGRRNVTSQVCQPLDGGQSQTVCSASAAASVVCQPLDGGQSQTRGAVVVFILGSLPALGRGAIPNYYGQMKFAIISLPALGRGAIPNMRRANRCPSYVKCNFVQVKKGSGLPVAGLKFLHSACANGDAPARRQRLGRLSFWARWSYERRRGCREFRASFGGKLSRPVPAVARLADDAEMARAELGPLAKPYEHPLTEILYSIWTESTKPSGQDGGLSRTVRTTGLGPQQQGRASRLRQKGASDAAAAGGIRSKDCAIQRGTGSGARRIDRGC